MAFYGVALSKQDKRPMAFEMRLLYITGNIRVLSCQPSEEIYQTPKEPRGKPILRLSPWLLAAFCAGTLHKKVMLCGKRAV